MALGTALTAFRESYLSIDPEQPAAFGEYNARLLRYRLLWAMFENTAYSKIHSWAQGFKIERGLYKYVRNIYNPSHRLAEFWQMHLLGGTLDPMAGDGSTVPSALPITTSNEGLRPAIARVWAASNLVSRKDLLSLWGVSLGDVFVRIIDDVARERVHLDVVHPARISELVVDTFGNIKGYTLVERRPDPRSAKPGRVYVTYKEIARRDGDDVVYTTYLDDRPYAWRKDAEGKPVVSWSEPYGFVPMVRIQHNDTGVGWGLAEIFPAISRAVEADDLASKVSDQIRKMVAAPWLLSGVEDPKKRKRTPTPRIQTTGAEATDEDPLPGREEIPVFYGPVGANAIPLVAPLNLADSVAHLKEVLADIEREYPELQLDIWRVSGDASGRALRVARQPIVIKVRQRRVNYDTGLIRAHQMAIAIGGFRGYEGYQGFDLDSYNAGRLDHTIAERPVFEVDPLDDLAVEDMFWSVASKAAGLGVALPLFLRSHGWTEDKIKEIISSEEYKMHIASGGAGALFG